MPLVDANLFLEVQLNQQRSKAWKAYLRRVKDEEISAMTTSFIVDTVSILMDHTECEPTQIRKFLLALLKYKGLTIYELSLVDRVTATALVEELRLDFDDATVCTAMRAANSTEIVSFDKHFDSVVGIRRIEP